MGVDRRGFALAVSKGANPRFVVTSLSREVAGAQYLYEKLYCARGDMENRIKECQLDLFADRPGNAGKPFGVRLVWQLSNRRCSRDSPQRCLRTQLSRSVLVVSDCP